MRVSRRQAGSLMAPSDMVIEGTLAAFLACYGCQPFLTNSERQCPVLSPCVLLHMHVYTLESVDAIHNVKSTAPHFRHSQQPLCVCDALTDVGLRG